MILKNKLVLVLDGPEKTGKSYLIDKVIETLPSHIKAVVHHWTGRARPDESIYAMRILNFLGETSKYNLMIYDRAWPSEFVYGRLLNQDRPMANTTDAPSWEHALWQDLLPIILLPDDIQKSIRLRDKSDLDVDPEIECFLYKLYGSYNGWQVLENTYDSIYAEALAFAITQSIEQSIKVGYPIYAPLAPYAIIQAPSRQQKEPIDPK